MAKLAYALNVSLDGYVDHLRFAPDAVLFAHFIEDVGSVAGSLYGSGMYDLMRYWDDDHAEWDGPRRDYATAWRSKPKWVVSQSLTSVGPNASLLSCDLATAVRALKASHEGIIEVSGPVLAASLTDLGLIDEYRLYLHPVVLGSGAPYFVRSRPALRLVETLRIGADVIRLTYVPAGGDA